MAGKITPAQSAPWNRSERQRRDQLLRTRWKALLKNKRPRLSVRCCYDYALTMTSSAKIRQGTGLKRRSTLHVISLVARALTNRPGIAQHQPGPLARVRIARRRRGRGAAAEPGREPVRGDRHVGGEPEDRKAKAVVFSRWQWNTQGKGGALLNHDDRAAPVHCPRQLAAVEAAEPERIRRVAVEDADVVVPEDRPQGNTGQRQCLSREGSGKTRQRQRLSREGSGKTRQRQCRTEARC